MNRNPSGILYADAGGLMFREKREWVKQVRDAWCEGKPEPALDQAGDLLDLLSDALDVISENPAARDALEAKLARR